MKLTADDKGRLTCREVFKPGSVYEVEAADPRVVLTRLVRASVPTVKPRRVNGRLRGADVTLDRRTVAAAIRADRDAR